MAVARLVGSRPCAQDASGAPRTTARWPRARAELRTRSRLWQSLLLLVLSCQPLQQEHLQALPGDVSERLHGLTALRRGHLREAAPEPLGGHRGHLSLAAARSSVEVFGAVAPAAAALPGLVAGGALEA